MLCLIQFWDLRIFCVAPAHLKPITSGPKFEKLSEFYHSPNFYRTWYIYSLMLFPQISKIAALDLDQFASCDFLKLHCLKAQSKEIACFLNSFNFNKSHLLPKSGHGQGKTGFLDPPRSCSLSNGNGKCFLCTYGKCS